jgi:hypothetical protein
MDNFHKILLLLLGISIFFLGFSVMKGNISPILNDNKKPEIWSTNITPDDFNTIADSRWFGQLKNINSTHIEGSEKVCLNICGNRCLWLGYSYKSHGVFPGTYLQGDNNNPICSCDCYIDKGFCEN